MRAFDWNGLNLQSYPFTVTATNIFDSPKVQVTSVELARADGVIDLYRKLGNREIDVTGQIKSTNEVDADLALDLFKKRVLSYIGSGSLSFGFADMTRTYTGKAVNSIITRSRTDISRMGYSFQVHTEKPYALDDAGSLQFIPTTVVATSSATIATTNDATYLASPYLTLQFNTVPGGSASATISIRNPQTSETLEITTNLTNGTTITIDTDKKRTFKGSEEIYASGIYPEWLPEGGLLDYSDNLATRNVTVSGNYMRKWL